MPKQEPTEPSVWDQPEPPPGLFIPEKTTESWIVTKLRQLIRAVRGRFGRQAAARGERREP